MTKIKVCGITNLEDALVAIDSGCDALGFVFTRSPRTISPEEAQIIIERLPSSIKKVGVFVNEDILRVKEIAKICRLDLLQFHGDETPDYCLMFELPIIKAFRIKDKESMKRLNDYQVAAYLLDSYSEEVYGGTGKGFNWELAKEAKAFGPIILAGGLNSSNVTRAIKEVEPYGVDVSSGVEESPGQKDHLKIREFIRVVRLVSLREEKEAGPL